MQFQDQFEYQKQSVDIQQSEQPISDPSSDSSYQQQPLLQPQRIIPLSRNQHRSDPRSFEQGRIGDIDLISIKLTLQQQVIKVFTITERIRQHQLQYNIVQVINLLQTIIGRITRLQIRRNDNQAMHLFRILRKLLSYLVQLNQGLISQNQFHNELQYMLNEISQITMTKKQRLLKCIGRLFLYFKKFFFIFWVFKTIYKTFFYPLSQNNQTLINKLQIACQAYQTWILLITTTIYICIRVYKSIIQITNAQLINHFYQFNIIPYLFLLSIVFFQQIISQKYSYHVSLLVIMLKICQIMSLSITNTLLKQLSKLPSVDEIGFKNRYFKKRNIYNTIMKTNLVGLFIWIVLAYSIIIFKCYSFWVVLIHMPLQGILTCYKLKALAQQTSITNKKSKFSIPIKQFIFYALLANRLNTYLVLINFFNQNYQWAKQKLLKNTLHTTQSKQGIFCVICREEAFRVIWLPCGHGFHQLCIQKSGWETCPVCRRTIGLKDILR